MLQAWDADGHVFESEVTFSDKYLEPAFRHRRPVVVEMDTSGTLGWAIDSRLSPTTTGPNQSFGGPPTKGGVPSLRTRTMMQANPLESIEFRSAAARLQQMDRENLAVMVNYPTMFLTWPLTYSPALAAALCRAYNDWIADISSRAPDRLKWVTVVDPQDPIEAAREIERTKQMGSVGVMLLGMVGDKHVDHPSLEPIWATAAEAELPMGIHVGFCCPPLGNLYTTTSGNSVVPFGFVVLMAFERIMSSGLLDRYPNLRVAFLEAGCQWVPFMVDRIAERSGLPGTRLEGTITLGRPESNGFLSQHPPKEYIRRGQVYFGFEVDDELLPFMVREYGPECLLYASDIPHSDRHLNSVDHLLGREDLSAEAKRKLLVENTARYYRLPVSQTAPSLPSR
jgi:predicted TIM-barrel fold metal-dependent hydrolase